MFLEAICIALTPLSIKNMKSVTNSQRNFFWAEISKHSNVLCWEYFIRQSSSRRRDSISRILRCQVPWIIAFSLGFSPHIKLSNGHLLSLNKIRHGDLYNPYYLSFPAWLYSSTLAVTDINLMALIWYWKWTQVRSHRFLKAQVVIYITTPFNGYGGMAQ